MKSLLIVILFVALLGAAFFTRPSRDDFKRYVVAQQTKGDSNIFSSGWDRMRAESFADHASFNDRLLWVNVDSGGTTVYTGAFGHWFNRAIVKEDVNKLEQTAHSAGHTINQGLDEIKKH